MLVTELFKPRRLRRPSVLYARRIYARRFASPGQEDAAPRGGSSGGAKVGGSKERGRTFASFAEDLVRIGTAEQIAEEALWRAASGKAPPIATASWGAREEGADESDRARRKMSTIT
jgi:hypothetical protein